MAAEHGVTTLAELEALFHPDSIEDVFDSDTPRKFAAALELKHIEWLAYDYVARDRKREPGSYPEAVAVG